MKWLKQAADYVLGLDGSQENDPERAGLIDAERHTLSGWIEQLRLGAERFSRQDGDVGLSGSQGLAGNQGLSAALSCVWAKASAGAEQGSLSTKQRSIIRRCAKLVEALELPLVPETQTRLLAVFQAAEAELDRDTAEAFDAVEYRLKQIENSLK